MSLTLYSHPLASFCHKVLIALYEKNIEFTNYLVDFGNPSESAKFLELRPVGKIPLLRDDARQKTVPETTIIIEYLDQHYPGALQLLPSDQEQRLDARLWDRFFDQYVQVPMQRIVADRLRGENERDPKGVADAQAALGLAYDVLEKHFTTRMWAIGDVFSIADCAAFPALFYADSLRPFLETHPKLAAYFERLLERPSVQRTLAEARPYFQIYPYKEKLRTRYLNR